MNDSDTKTISRSTYVWSHIAVILFHTILGILLIRKNFKESFYLYLIAVVAFTSQIYTQYFAIPLIASITAAALLFTTSEDSL